MNSARVRNGKVLVEHRFPASPNFIAVRSSTMPRAGSSGSAPPATPPRPPTGKRPAAAVASATPKKAPRPSGPVVKPLTNSVEASAKKHLLGESYHGTRFGMLMYVDLIIISTDGGRLSEYDINAEDQLYGMTAMFGRGTYQLNESIKKSCFSQAARDADPSYRCPTFLHNSRAFGGINLLYGQCHDDNVCDDHVCPQVLSRTSSRRSTTRARAG